MKVVLLKMTCSFFKSGSEDVGVFARSLGMNVVTLGESCGSLKNFFLDSAAVVFPFFSIVYIETFPLTLQYKDSILSLL